MFRVPASNLTEYLTFDQAREADLRLVDKTIRTAAPNLKRYFFDGTSDGKPGMSMSMIGYGTFQYHVKATADPIKWPVIGMALQKNYISLYVAAIEDERYVIERYTDRLGKATVGRNMARFAKAADLDLDGLAEMVTYIGDGVRAGTLEMRYGRAGKQ